MMVPGVFGSLASYVIFKMLDRSESQLFGSPVEQELILRTLLAIITCRVLVDGTHIEALC